MDPHSRHVAAAIFPPSHRPRRRTAPHPLPISPRGPPAARSVPLRSARAHPRLWRTARRAASRLRQRPTRLPRPTVAPRARPSAVSCPRPDELGSPAPRAPPGTGRLAGRGGPPTGRGEGRGRGRRPGPEESGVGSWSGGWRDGGRGLTAGGVGTGYFASRAFLKRLSGIPRGKRVQGSTAKGLVWSPNHSCSLQPA